MEYLIQFLTSLVNDEDSLRLVFIGTVAAGIFVFGLGVMFLVAGATDPLRRRLSAVIGSLAGNLESAQRNLEFALSKNPQYERAWMNLGLMYTRRGQYEEALSAFRQVMDDAEAWNNVGYLCMMDGKYGPAESFILQAISLSPNYYANAHENLKRVHELRSR